MRGELTAILLIICNLTFGQNHKIEVLKWDSFTICDKLCGYYEYNYNILIQNGEYILTDSSISKKIDKLLLNELFSALKTPMNLKKDPLLAFNRDSTWLFENAERLWKTYAQKQKIVHELDSMAISTIRNYQQVKFEIFNLQGFYMTEFYPRFTAKIVKNTDTLIIKSISQFPYMLPWEIDDVSIYNSRISEIFADILPGNRGTNKKLLHGDDFEYFMIDRIYENVIKEKLNKK